MKPHSVRPICRSRNPFSPSIALWQHFVLPCSLLRQQRPLSTATGTPSPQASEVQPHAENHEAITSGPGSPDIRIRKVLDIRKENKFRSPRDAKYADIVEKKSKQTRIALSIAKNAAQISADYKARIVTSMKSRVPYPEAKLPWVVSKNEASSARQRLSLEIARFYQYARPSRTEALARRKVIEQVRKDVSDVFPDKILEVFGSERTGLALATSDIDLRLMSNSPLQGDSASPVLLPATEERKALLDSLFTLMKSAFVGNPEYILPKIRYARYPLICMQHQKSSLDIQIVCANDTTLSRSLMQQYMQEYPHLREVYFVVKTIFDQRGLSDVFRGGFGSYPLFMMLVASIKHKTSPQNDAASMLIEFLRFWANLDTPTQGVSIEPPTFFDKYTEPVMTPTVKAQLESGEIKPLPPYMLCLRDPADDTNDLGRKGTSIKHVQLTLDHLHKKLTESLRGDSGRPSLLKPLVGDSYSNDFIARKKLTEYGSLAIEEMHGFIAEKAKAIRAEDAAAAVVEEDGRGRVEDGMTA